MKRFPAWLFPLGAVVICGVVFPPVSFRSRAEVELTRATAQFSGRDFVQKFWNEHLVPSHARAHEAAVVHAALTRDRAAACAAHGRTLGIGGAYTFYLRGSGRVVSSTGDEVRLAVAGASDQADIVIPLGLVFGNAVRDGTGLLDSSAFPNAQQFNDVAAELNALVESQVLPELQRIATVGARVAFVGCAELNEDANNPVPLRLVPVWVQREE